MTESLTLPELVAAIAQLSPAERRALQRHLRAAGLAVQEEFVTDKNRLQIAPALGVVRTAVQSDDADVEHPPATVSRQSDQLQEPPSLQTIEQPWIEQPIGIIFDGGSRGNPGQGYGSYALRWPGAEEQIVRLRFGEQVTNNEAEYDTLLAALDAVLKKLQELEASPAQTQLEVRGDSKLVINQINGEWASKEPRMRARRDRARAMLEQFGAWQLLYHPRARNVQTLGH